MKASLAPRIRTSQSCAADPRQAVSEFFESVVQPDMGFVVFFCSPDYDLDVVATEIERRFGGVAVLGCTTAGQFGSQGYCNIGLSGASFPRSHFAAASGLLNGLGRFEIAAGQAFTKGLLDQLEVATRAPVDPERSFAFLLIDGLSVREEPVARTLQHALGNVAMFGGSAGDGLRFGTTQIYANGRFHSDSAALLVVSTPLPFRIFKTQHFVSTQERMVVTAADAEKRVVLEINGMPAAGEYARLVGVDVNDLDPLRFAASPVVVLIDGVDYVRSIQKANPDGSLTFYCAIEEGLVLRVARGVGLLPNLTQAFADVTAQIGPLQVVLGCDCVLRKLEIEQHGLCERVASVLRAHNAVGFNTYGEQYGGVHVNQTFTAIAIGEQDAGNG